MPVTVMKAETSLDPNWFTTRQVYIPSSSFRIPGSGNRSRDFWTIPVVLVYNMVQLVLIMGFCSKNFGNIDYQHICNLGIYTCLHLQVHNKRSMDLGALLDTCNWCDKWQFSTDLFHSNIWPTKLL